MSNKGFSITKFNRRLFDIDTKDFNYYSLKEITESSGETEFPLRAIYINRKSQFGDSPVFATDSCFVNIPSHMLDACLDILEDSEAVEAINDCRVGFKVETYKATNYGNKECYSVSFIDWE